MDAMAPEAGLSGAKPPRNARRRNIAYWQAAPFALLFLLFFIVPLVLTAGLLIPVIEEIAFRGLMLRGQERAAEIIASGAEPLREE